METIGQDTALKTEFRANFLSSAECNLDVFMKNYPNIILDDQERNNLLESKCAIEKVKHKPTVKHQHYVPETYLKSFCGSDEKLRIIDLETRRLLKPKKPRWYCSDEFFYAGKTGDNDLISQIWEEIFNSFEQTFSNRFKEISSEILGYGKISERCRWSVAEFMAVSFLRTKAFRKQLERMEEDFIKQVMPRNYEIEKELHPDSPYVKAISGNPDTEKFLMEGQYSVKFAHNGPHFEYLSGEKIKELAKWFMVKRWSIFISTGEYGFVTSDIPVLEMEPDRPRSPYGFSIMDRDYHFPLSPKILITLSRPDSGKKIRRKQVGDTEVAVFNAVRLSFGSFGFARNEIELSEYVAGLARNSDFGRKFDYLARG